MKKRLQFSLSPHKVALSILIQDFCSPDRVPSAVRPLLAVFLLDNVRQAHDYREKTLSELCAALSALQPPMGAALAHQLVQALRKICSPDDLFDTLMALELLLMDNPSVDDDIPGLEQSSVLGIFVRKVLITFHATMFEGLSELYTHVVGYLEAFSNNAAGDTVAQMLKSIQCIVNIIGTEFFRTFVRRRKQPCTRSSATSCTTTAGWWRRRRRRSTWTRASTACCSAWATRRAASNSEKVLFILNLYSRYTRALTFQNFVRLIPTLPLCHAAQGLPRRRGSSPPLLRLWHVWAGPAQRSR